MQFFYFTFYFHRNSTSFPFLVLNFFLSTRIFRKFLVQEKKNERIKLKRGLCKVTQKKAMNLKPENEKLLAQLHGMS